MLTFVSDAAGASLEWIGGISKNVTVTGDPGVAAVGHEGDRINWIGEIRWPKHLLIGQKSCEGKYFGSKNATLETVGLLLPFVARPKELSDCHILLQVDNSAVVYAWKKKYSPNDPETSLFIRCLHIVEAFLECKIYVKHLKRMSTWTASTADTLSRCSTTTRSILESLDGIPWGNPNGPLITSLDGLGFAKEYYLVPKRFDVK